MSSRLCKWMLLRSRSDYKRLLKPSKRYRGDLLSIDIRFNGMAVTRLGLTVVKKFGDAHRRNRLKRIVREAFRLSYSSLFIGIDINIRPQRAANEATSSDLQQELLRFLDKKLWR